MTEFVDLLTTIGRRLSEEDLGGEPTPRCVVSHPDAGGECGKAATFEVYGLNFCEVLEAYHGALTRFHFEAYVEFERVDNPHVPSLHPGFMEVLRSASKAMNEECGRHEQAHARYVLEAYPLLEERVHAWAWEWDPAVPDGHAPPYDEFLNGYMQVRGFMLSAAQAHAPGCSRRSSP